MIVKGNTNPAISIASVTRSTTSRSPGKTMRRSDLTKLADFLTVRWVSSLCTEACNHHTMCRQCLCLAHCVEIKCFLRHRESLLISSHSQQWCIMQEKRFAHCYLKLRAQFTSLECSMSRSILMMSIAGASLSGQAGAKWVSIQSHVDAYKHS